jgi:hypothetical protein
LDFYDAGTAGSYFKGAAAAPKFLPLITGVLANLAGKLLGGNIPGGVTKNEVVKM